MTTISNLEINGLEHSATLAVMAQSQPIAASILNSFRKWVVTNYTQGQPELESIATVVKAAFDLEELMEANGMNTEQKNLVACARAIAQGRNEVFKHITKNGNFGG